MKGAFKYIDDDLQNLKQLLNFRLDDVMPQQKDRSCRSSEYQETNNKDLFHMSSSTNTYGEQPRILGKFSEKYLLKLKALSVPDGFCKHTGQTTKV